MNIQGPSENCRGRVLTFAALTTRASELQKQAEQNIEIGRIRGQSVTL